MTEASTQSEQRLKQNTSAWLNHTELTTNGLKGTFNMKITKDMIKRQYAKNAKQLAEMADKAAIDGLCNGYTEAYLRDKADEFNMKAATL